MQSVLTAACENPLKAPILDAITCRATLLSSRRNPKGLTRRW